MNESSQPPVSNVTTPPSVPQPSQPEHHGKLKWVVIIIVVIVALLGVGAFALMKMMAPASTDKPAAKQEVNALTFYTWWTSASEGAALAKLQKVFSDKFPDTAIVAAPVTGGAGFKMLPLIKSLVSSGESPDAFQLHAGYEAQPFYDAGLLGQVDYLWKSEGLEAVVPAVIQDMMKFGGHYYGVPVDVHRANIIWYNKSVLSKQGIDPATLTTWDSIFKASDKLKAAGVAAPIQMGEAWTAGQTFETILAGEGIDFYQDWVNGKVTSATDPKLLDALNTYKKYLTYVNKDHEDTAWDAATKRIIKGEGAFNLMGDWANGEFKLVGMKYGTDYGTIPAPGTAGMYGLVVDSFQHPKDVQHPTNSDRWLKTVVSKEGQDAFNPTKGSISMRSDSDVTAYDAYQKSAIADFKSAKYMYPSVANGSGAPESFKIELNTAMTAFATDLNVQKAATDLTSFTSKNITDYKKVWALKGK